MSDRPGAAPPVGRDRDAPATVVVTSRSFGTGTSDAEATLADHGLRVVRGDAGHATDALEPLLRDAVAWIAGAAPVEDTHLELAPRLRVLARYGTGVDAIDLEAAQRRGVTVTNTPGANAPAVAEHTLALMLACLRRLPAADRQVRAGAWPALRSRELGALTVGLVGFGAVGRRVARLAAPFGCTLLTYDPALDAAGVARAAGPGISVTRVDLDTLLERGDVVSLHCPPAAEPLVDDDTIARMRPDAVLVNTARAALVDEHAVARALQQDRLGAYGTDVLSARTPGAAPLLDAPRTVFTPHCAAHTVQAIDRMTDAAAAEVVRVAVRGTAPLHPVVSAT